MINKDSKILITGGSGLVGQNLTNRLHKEGYSNIRVNLHKRGVRTPIDGVEYVHFDLKTYEGCLDATKEIDVVYSQGWVLVDKGKKVFNDSDLKERNTLHGYFSSEKFIHILFRKNPIPILSAVVKKSKIDDVNGFGEELDIQNAEDFL